MANWLLDYIEMTEYIPSELREQLISIRELDLKVHNAMDELERDIKQFFAKINTLSQQERQAQYDAFLKKCDVATEAASDKVRVADKLHDLVEKSMRLLDQGLEKLKEDLLEGDKAYVVEDLERRSQQMDEQQRLEQETILQRQQKIQELKTSSAAPNCRLTSIETTHSNNSNSHANHRHSLPAQQMYNSKNSNSQQHYHNDSNNIHHHQLANQPNHRSRTNSAGVQPNSVGRHKKRERVRLNSAMTIFNRNSRPNDGDSTNQSFLGPPLTPDYLVNIHQSNRSLAEVAGTNSSALSLKGMMVGNRNPIGTNDKSNGNDPLAGAKQPILTAIDAAHAVSPKATNSDKLVLFSSNANGDNNYNNLTHNLGDLNQQNHSNPLNAAQNHLPYAGSNKLGNQLLATANFNAEEGQLVANNHLPSSRSLAHDQNHRIGQAFGSLPLSSGHDPIMMAASQAINATQSMAPGRRTSSLKASYAAVNSGRLQPPMPSQQAYDQGALVHEVYCTCQSHIQGSDMIACDNDNCKIEWFHYECVGITTPPEGNWYCTECRLNLGIHAKGSSSNKQPKLEGISGGDLTAN